MWRRPRGEPGHGTFRQLDRSVFHNAWLRRAKEGTAHVHLPFSAANTHFRRIQVKWEEAEGSNRPLFELPGGQSMTSDLNTASSCS